MLLANKWELRKHIIIIVWNCKKCIAIEIKLELSSKVTFILSSVTKKKWWIRESKRKMKETSRRRVDLWKRSQSVKRDRGNMEGTRERCSFQKGRDTGVYVAEMRADMGTDRDKLRREGGRESKFSCFQGFHTGETLGLSISRRTTTYQTVVV